MVPTREVWRIHTPGALDRLTRETERLEAPPAGHARVAIGAIGLNFADVFACLGLYSATPKGPFVPGLEFAGTVEAVGTEVTSVTVGDRVIGLTRFGAYATAINADVRYLHPLPAGWSLAEGAALPVQAITAWYAINELGACRRGHSVLVQSAAGGVGLLALDILEGLGARVIATVGRESKVAFLEERAHLGRRQIVVRDRHRFGKQLDEVLRANEMDGFHLVLDAVAGPFFMPAYRRLRPQGRLVIYGAADLMPAATRTGWLQVAARYLTRPRLDPIRMVTSNKSVMGFNLIWLWEQVDRLADAYAALTPYVVRPPHVGRRCPFADAPAAVRYLQSGKSVGKVVLDLAE